MNLPAVSTFDLVTAGMAAAVYVIVALAALARQPRDIRTRLFLVVAVTSAVAYGMPFAQAMLGNAGMLSKRVIGPMLIDMGIASIALFHFTQVFPWRRPWIARFGEWVAAAYLVAPMIIAWLVWFAPSSVDRLGVVYIIAVIALGVPLFLLLGAVLPLAGLLSLYKSYQTAARERIETVRQPLLGILISQIAGGILSVFVAPIVHVLAPTGPWSAIIAGALFAFNLMMPAAFALWVWRNAQAPAATY
jgi:hypothetical protein